MTNKREEELLKACEDARHELSFLHNLIVRDREDGPEWYTDTTDVVKTLTAVLENKTEPQIMTNENQARLAEIDARCEAATPGPWEGDWSYNAFIYGKGDSVALAYSAENACFIIHARDDMPWMSERIADLEDEVDYYREAQKETLDIAMAERTRLLAHITDLERRAAVSRKWARRWKLLAKEQLRIERVVVRQADYRDAQQSRIAALENACRSCATCYFGAPVLDDKEPPNECFVCADSGKKYGGWVFAEKRFAPKEGEKDSR